LVAWTIAAIISVLVITKGRKNGIWAGFFILSFILIQLLEFFIWWNRQAEGLTSSAAEAVEEGDGVRNRPSGEVFTRLILIALWLQPLVQTFMAYRYGNPNFKKHLLVATMAYFVMFIWSILQATDPSVKFSSAPVTGTCGHGHLAWRREGKGSFAGPHPASFLYGFGLAFGLLFVQPTVFGISFLVLGAVMLTYSAKNFRTGEASSMWCIYAIFYAFLALLIAFSRRS
jgi:hypothetical protein